MLLNCDCILARVLEKTGFHYFIFHRKPLHWDGHGLGLGLECSGLVNITGFMCCAVLRPFPTVNEPKVSRAAVGTSVTLRCQPPSSQPPAIIHWASVTPLHASPTIIEPTDRIAFDDEGELQLSVTWRTYAR